ncbi:GntR family transcriptional regulator [Paraburkholderia sp. BL10I2N1]|uniref:GntR family transcriptional regulator n=1 Tax=Paraburkholderia sp. BL10I2N1 TaxID=1938796 RepID=UPI00105CAFED|nr:GntR family transcriptional regulator [Paraburkholderia sp. BL10I2N1]TDN70532.1 DNA-binding GntR family transcriptional regulator [Paraburkholderia sp. BL10I2N1]
MTRAEIKAAGTGVKKASRKSTGEVRQPEALPVQTEEAVSETRVASLGERAYRRLREMILDRELEAGALLNELRVADQLDMSRTPVREALIRLTGEGLLVRADARSFAVRTVSAREFFESMRVREVLEAQAIDLGIQRLTPVVIEALEAKVHALEVGKHTEVEHRELDDLLHRTIAEASGNAVLVQMIAMMRLNARLFRVTSHLHRQQENHVEHLAILAALKSRDKVEARNAMISHIRGLQDDVIKAITG